VARPRRLTREESRVETRRRLLDAAEQVFAERGFHGASIEEIAGRAGFSSGAFYSNFDDKQELFLALFDRRTEAQLAAVAELMHTNPAPADFFEALREWNVRRGNQRAWLMLSLEFVLYTLRNPRARLKLAERERRGRDAYARGAIVQHEALGLSLPAPPDQLGLILQALDQGFALQESIDPETVPEDAFIDALAFLLKASAALAEQTAREETGRSQSRDSRSRPDTAGGPLATSLGVTGKSPAARERRDRTS
jgi:AcrR family transcriptional regulator